MTRDEAIKIWDEEVISKQRVGITADVIRGFAALGILKLDEPKSARDKFKDAMKEQLYTESSSGMKDALKAFDAALK